MTVYSKQIHFVFSSFAYFLVFLVPFKRLCWRSVSFWRCRIVSTWRNAGRLDEVCWTRRLDGLERRYRWLLWWFTVSEHTWHCLPAVDGVEPSVDHGWQHHSTVCLYSLNTVLHTVARKNEQSATVKPRSHRMN